MQCNFDPFLTLILNRIDRVMDQIDQHLLYFIFITTNPDINWNGKDQNSGKDVIGGVYFYICDVFERYLDGTRKRSIHGSITILR